MKKHIWFPIVFFLGALCGVFLFPDTQAKYAKKSCNHDCELIGVDTKKYCSKLFPCPNNISENNVVLYKRLEYDTILNMSGDSMMADFCFSFEGGQHHLVPCK